MFGGLLLSRSHPLPAQLQTSQPVFIPDALAQRVKHGLYDASPGIPPGLRTDTVLFLIQYVLDELGKVCFGFIRKDCVG